MRNGHGSTQLVLICGGHFQSREVQRFLHPPSDSTVHAVDSELRHCSSEASSARPLAN